MKKIALFVLSLGFFVQASVYTMVSNRWEYQPDDQEEAFYGNHDRSEYERLMRIESYRYQLSRQTMEDEDEEAGVLFFGPGIYSMKLSETDLDLDERIEENMRVFKLLKKAKTPIQHSLYLRLKEDLEVKINKLKSSLGEKEKDFRVLYKKRRNYLLHESNEAEKSKEKVLLEKELEDHQNMLQWLERVFEKAIKRKV